MSVRLGLGTSMFWDQSGVGRGALQGAPMLKWNPFPQQQQELSTLVGIDLDRSAHNIARRRLAPLVEGERRLRLHVVHGNFW